MRKNTGKVREFCWSGKVGTMYEFLVKGGITFSKPCFTSLFMSRAPGTFANFSYFFHVIFFVKWFEKKTTTMR